jgi:hypothetical protein
MNTTYNERYQYPQPSRSVSIALELVVVVVNLCSTRIQSKLIQFLHSACPSHIIMSSVVGVDLGYQNSVIAAAGRGGVDVILNGNSNRLNPYVPKY